MKKILKKGFYWGWCTGIWGIMGLMVLLSHNPI